MESWDHTLWGGSRRSPCRTTSEGCRRRLGGREGKDCADFGLLIGCLIVGVTRVAFNPLEGLPF